MTLTIEADLKVEETISKETFKHWYKEAEAGPKKQGFEGVELQKRADAIRYERLQEHIAKGGKNVYRLERGSGNDFIIASDKAIAGATAGPRASASGHRRASDWLAGRAAEGSRRAPEPAR